MFALVAIGFLLGAAVGSFLNVCAYRIPRQMSVVYGRSSCPACLQVLPWYELIPILSFIVICRGRCTRCGDPVSLQYPVVEFLSGAWVVFVVLTGGLSPASLLLVLFGLSMLLVALVDWQHYLIPNKMLLWSLLPAAAIKATMGIAVLWNAFVALAASFLVVFAILLLGRFIFGREVMGMGDVKLAAVIAFMLGLNGLLFSLWLGAVSGLGFAGVRSVTGGSRTQKELWIPFGSFLAFSAVLVALFGSETQGFTFFRELPWLNF
jgi:leader peptidase (prepilin peptidase) / N-methyltransferase